MLGRRHELRFSRATREHVVDSTLSTRYLGGRERVSDAASLQVDSMVAFDTPELIRNP
jgi:hypothetical protein